MWMSARVLTANLVVFMLRYFSAKAVNIGTLALLFAFLAIRWQGLINQIDCLVAAMMLSLFASLFNYRRLLKITEAPISTIAAAAQGYVELHGTASTARPLKTPFHSTPCVWYRAWVYANIADEKIAQRPISMRLLEYVESSEIFQLNDETGRCTINPIGAEVIFFQARTWRKNNHRYVEHYLPADKPLYVIGQLDSRKDVFNAAAFNRDLSLKLAEWKSRPRQLLQRYDQNLNGQIDMDEWEMARRDAAIQVKAEHAMQANLGNFTLHKPKNNHLFLISAKSPQQLRDVYKQWAIVYFCILCSLLIVYVKLS